MSAKTGIEWTDRAWNPTRGCSLVSEGCRNCYAMKFAHRFSWGQRITRKDSAGRVGWTGEVEPIEEALTLPLRWRTPSRIFVNSMSDLFHREVPDEWIDRIFAVMAVGASDVERCFRRDCSHDPCEGDGSGRFARHTYQILTKRPARMRSYLADPQRQDLIAEALSDLPGFTFGDSVHENICADWPLPNVWFGVSVEDQWSANERVPLLLQTPAAVRFVSYEPAIGPVDFARWLPCPRDTDSDGNCGQRCCAYCDGTRPSGPRLDQIIVGGESGPGARPFDVAWARSTIQQCREAGVACFVKQLGARARESAEHLLLGDLGWPDGVKYDARHEFVSIRDRKGGDPSEWPEDLRVREMPEVRR